MSDDLIVLAQRGDADGVARALDAGVPVDQPGATGETALMIAASRGHLAVVDLLLRRGAAVNATTQVGNTALMFAAARGKAAAVRQLLANGADVRHKNKYGLGASDWAKWADDRTEMLTLTEASGSD